MAKKSKSGNSKQNSLPAVVETALSGEDLPLEEEFLEMKEDEENSEEEEDDEEDDFDDSEDLAAQSVVIPSTGAVATRVRKERGPRKIAYVTGGLVEMSSDDVRVISEKYLVKTVKNSYDHAGWEAQARAKFRAQYKEEPTFCLGPFYLVRDPSLTPGKKRESLRLEVGRKYGFNGKSGTAIHKGWRVFVNYTRNPDVIMVQYDKVVDPAAAGQKDLTKKLQSPNPKYIRSSAVTNLKEDEEVTATQ